MPSLCPVCQDSFTSWVEYHEHVALQHGVDGRKATKTPKRGDYKGPMDKAVKRLLVLRGEIRLGSHFFIGAHV